MLLSLEASHLNTKQHIYFLFSKTLYRPEGNPCCSQGKQLPLLLLLLHLHISPKDIQQVLGQAAVCNQSWKKADVG